MYKIFASIFMVLAFVSLAFAEPMPVSTALGVYLEPAEVFDSDVNDLVVSGFEPAPVVSKIALEPSQVYVLAPLDEPLYDVVLRDDTSFILEGYDDNTTENLPNPVLAYSATPNEVGWRSSLTF